MGNKLWDMLDLNYLKVPKSMKQPYKIRNVHDILDFMLIVIVEVIVCMQIALSGYNCLCLIFFPVSVNISVCKDAHKLVSL